VNNNEDQRVRSPRYPSVGLREAEVWARRIFDQDGLHPMDRESAAKHLGYTTLNGASASALASLKQYGLTADAGKGLLRLTPLALDILEPESDASRRAALATAAFKPELFAALQERFPERLPSEPNLRAHLLRQHFTSAAIKSVIPAYLETCEYLASAQGSERTGLPVGLMQESFRSDREEDNTLTSNMLPALREERPVAPATPSPAVPAAAGRRMVFDTPDGEVIITWPEGLAEEHVEDIETWLTLVTKRMRKPTKH